MARIEARLDGVEAEHGHEEFALAQVGQAPARPQEEVRALASRRFHELVEQYAPSGA